ncbi:MAG: thioredoxin-dependent thiol peroxidase [Elusimicrobia bacterium]|nr:thioredoxin-dependent thiol peroxidase [Elusimicrobiota bacterium]
MPTTKDPGLQGAKAAPPPKGPDIQVGDTAPPFDAVDQDGKRHRLSDYLGKTVVLYFYPKDDTPGCTQEACDFKAFYPKLKKKGAVIFGVSADSAKSHLAFKKKHGLPFSLLADEDKKICKAYGVWGEKSLYGRKFMGIVRSTFVIGEGGKITRMQRKVSVAGHVKALLDGA